MHQRYKPSKDFTFENTYDILYNVQYCIASVTFSPLQVKNKSREGAMMNVHLLLVLLA
jgi:hypothetical protein